MLFILIQKCFAEAEYISWTDQKKVESLAKKVDKKTLILIDTTGVEDAQCYVKKAIRKFQPSNGQVVALATNIATAKNIRPLLPTNSIPTKKESFGYGWKEEPTPEKETYYENGVLVSPRGDTDDFFGYVTYENLKKKFPEIDYEKYPADSRAFKQAKSVDLKSHKGGRLYRSAIRAGFKENPIIGGHYKLITVGCGTSCTMNWIVDLEKGKIIDSLYYVAGVKGKINSRMLIQNSVALTLADNFITDATFWEISKNKLRKVKYLTCDDIIKERPFHTIIVIAKYKKKTVEHKEKQSLMIDNNYINFIGIYEDDVVTNTGLCK